jgi:cold shock CspA family protein
MGAAASGGRAVDCIAVRRDRGLQAREILSIDLSDAVEPMRLRPGAGGDRAERMELIDSAGPFEPVTVKWFKPPEGIWLLVRDGDSSDIFVHMETLRRAEIYDIDQTNPFARVSSTAAKGRLRWWSNRPDRMLLLALGALALVPGCKGRWRRCGGGATGGSATAGGTSPRSRSKAPAGAMCSRSMWREPRRNSSAA